jgi:hypothetical protein
MIYNIIYDKKVELETLEQNLLQAHTSIVKSFPSLGVITIDTESADFQTIDGVLSWEEDTLIEATPETWHKNRIYSETLPMLENYYPNNLGADKTVYVMDSGIFLEHSEFTNKNIELLYSFDDTFVDTLGHGTAVSSLIVGETLGVSPEVTLKVVKIPMLQSIHISKLLEIFDVVLQDHNLTPEIKVVNCSWTIPKSLLLDTKISELQEAGLVVVAAAGNGGQDANNFSPVGLNSVLGVGASDVYDRVISWGAGSSNWGPDVDITAPGVGISVAQLNGTIMSTSGTSLSAAIVSAVVAQYMVEFPEMTSLEIQEKIISRAREELLFRNESIYGTTPNKFIAAAGISNIFNPEQNRYIKVKRGESAQQELIYREEIVGRIKTEGTIYFGTPRVNPDWFSYDETTKIFTVSPPEDLTPAIYRIYFQARGKDDGIMANGTFRINVYENTPEENETPENIDIYLGVQNENIVVMPAPCSTNFCFSTGSCYGEPEEKLGSCECINNECGELVDFG